MKQLITRASYYCFYGAGTVYHNLFAGQEGSGWEAAETFPNVAKTLCPLPGTFKNLVILSNDATHTAATFTVQKNGVDTGLIVTIGTDVPAASNIVDTVTVAAGDWINLKAVNNGALVFYPGWKLGFAIEFENSSTNQSFYGITPFATPSSMPIGRGLAGGAFCNGVWEVIFGGAIGARTNTYSLSSINGNIKQLHLKSTYVASLGSCVFTAWLRLNGVIQDGTGGTVDTATIINSGVLYASRTFTVPLARLDFAEIYIEVSGAGTPAEATGGIACAVVVEGTTAGEFIINGGSNNSFSQTDDASAWIGSFQLTTTELQSHVPIGPTGLTITSLYCEQFVGAYRAPGAGSSYTVTLVKTSVNTTVTIAVANLVNFGSIVGQNILFDTNDTAVLMYHPINTPATGGFHWAMAGKIPGVIPAAYAGIYKLVPGKTHDTLWNDINAKTTVDVAIPNPSFEL